MQICTLIVQGQIYIYLQSPTLLTVKLTFSVGRPKSRIQKESILWPDSLDPKCRLQRFKVSQGFFLFVCLLLFHDFHLFKKRRERKKESITFVCEFDVITQSFRVKIGIDSAVFRLKICHIRQNTSNLSFKPPLFTHKRQIKIYKVMRIWIRNSIKSVTLSMLDQTTHSCYPELCLCSLFHTDFVPVTLTLGNLMQVECIFKKPAFETQNGTVLLLTSFLLLKLIFFTQLAFYC